MTEPKKLSKNLTLFDVYALATGAMFSSGFFLLPGIAASYTGPSVYLAYLAAGFLILPAMLSMAELSTAMPKAGGAYYFLDRSLGPLMGTIGGLGSWLALTLKSAFALLGMGAYLALYIEVPVTFLAIILTLGFGVLNIFGAKETTMLQRVLVTTLVLIMGYFVVQGMIVIGPLAALGPSDGYDSFFTSGLSGFIATVGLVFVSYAGLTKVASVAEEVKNPDRNIPLGMSLALLTATVIYVFGVMIMINVLEPEDFYKSLTPVADAGSKFLEWLPGDTGVLLIVIAAIAAFASTGNAGIMSASRYPFAMAKDELVTPRLSVIGRFGTPTLSIVATTLFMVAILIFFKAESVAKLASAFQLLLFGLLNLSVIVMRESRIETYKPGFSSPFYPWVQIAGMMISFWLIAEMGMLAIGFTGMLVLICVIWFYFYTSGDVEREGAIYHVHERLGKRRYMGLEHELMTIVHERGEDEKLSYEEVVARSEIIDIIDNGVSIDGLVEQASKVFSERLGIDKDILRNSFETSRRVPYRPLKVSVYLNYIIQPEANRPEMVVFRIMEGQQIDIPGGEAEPVHALLFLVTPQKPPGLDLRLAGHLAEVIQSRNFLYRWLNAESPKELRDILTSDDHFLHVKVKDIPQLLKQSHRRLADIDLPGSCMIVLIERGGDVIIAHPRERLHRDDEVAIIGEPDDLFNLRFVT